MPEAMEEYQRALEIDPQHFAAHNNLANALSSARRIAEAIGQFRAASRARPDFAEVYVNLGGSAG